MGSLDPEPTEVLRNGVGQGMARFAARMTTQVISRGTDISQKQDALKMEIYRLRDHSWRRGVKRSTQPPCLAEHTSLR